MRMNNQWLEAMGLRLESDTITTGNLLEALNWLGERTRQPTLSEGMIAHFGTEQRLHKGQ